MNERIRVPEVRVIDQNNEQLGVISTVQALALAREAGVDLVEVAPNSNPPVCRLMNYGKMKYEQKKKDHKAKVKQHNVTLKEVRLRPKIDENDKNIKVNKARDFLKKGNKVQFTMLFRGREMMFLDRAMEMVQEIAETLEDVARVEVPPRKMGRRMTMVLTPENIKQNKK